MASGNGRMMNGWDCLHPWRLHLAYEGTRCPYDQPVRRKRGHTGAVAAGCVSWMDALLGVPSTNATAVQSPETRGDELSPRVAAVPTDIPCPLPSEVPRDEDLAANLARCGGGPPLEPAGAQLHERCEVKGSEREEAPLDWSGATCPHTSDINTGVPTESKQCFELPVVSDGPVNQGAPSEGAAARADAGDPKALETPLLPGMGECPEVTGAETDPVPCANGAADNAGQVEKCVPLPGQWAQMNDLLADTVERLYTKLQGTAMKVVMLDDLNQQLTECFGPCRKGGHSEDRTELALYLYALREHVEQLKKLWSQHEEAQRVAAEAQRQEKKPEPTERTVRVEIVRAYETPPVPYKKAPFKPLVTEPPPQSTSGSTSSSIFSSSTSYTTSYTSSSSYSYSSSSSPTPTPSSSTLEAVSESVFSSETVYTEESL
ncbi:hypothetical protein ERJ75_001190600 [Trypanosoma vivax]|uniref:Uncharacterized protein n=1 Tax=Trypanosoma vivax (strain Y486) TaxID=1055687 RepID=G0UBY0_TRYVY|nr:hypothetical protein TRVL_05357 [Trypanosoma vivax]KAH8609523.1 hypothetical protein ERJ75_001190600 [Trypanosoma vivax]CCC53328.1 conserved hypothetical protein [Trypanosoma vivax Y486]